jgi:TonB family protein
VTEAPRVDRDDILELLEIDRAATDLPETGRAEPLPAMAPPSGEDDEPGRLDPDRAQEESERIAPLGRRRELRVGMLGSLCLHLLPLLALVHWTGTPPEVDTPIPVQLVMEAPPKPPPPPPAPAPKVEKPPPRGRLASEDTGETTKQQTTDATATPGSAEPERTELAAIVPPPPPKPVPPPKPAVPNSEFHRLDTVPQAAPHETRVPGPAATRDEYLAYLVGLTRRHIDLLPSDVIGDKKGETVLEIVVLADGTIARIDVAHGSGYPEIDERVEQMVAAVHRFPPLPQWYQGHSVALNFRLRFPEALEH